MPNMDVAGFGGLRAFRGLGSAPDRIWLWSLKLMGRAATYMIWQAYIRMQKEVVMVLTAAHISPLIALIAGVLILIAPQLLNYVVAIYLIVIGLVGLNDIYHFVT
jgi:hypothetical protein